MRQWTGWLASAMVTLTVLAADDLPTQDPNESMEIEPPLLIGNRAADGAIILAPPAAGQQPVEVDVARLESDLARARKSAASGDRLYKSGIIAKVEAEERALKVIRLEAKLADARLEEAKRQKEAETPNTDAIAQAETAARRATEERQRAELEAALRNLQRQQKLLALGSGRRADVNRAEQKVAELQRPPN